VAFELTTVGYGPPAVAALGDAVRAAKQGDPLAPVTVVVPSNYAAVATRRALAAAGPGIAAVTTLTLHRLAERLGGPALAAAGRRPLSPPVVAEAVRRVLAEAPGMFAPVAAHPATEQALVAASRELRAVTDEKLDALAGASARAREVVRVHRAVHALLRPGWHDEHDLLRAATDVVQGPGGAAQVARVAGRVILHLPQELTPAAAELLRALAGCAPVGVVAGLTGEADADAAVRRSLALLGLTPPPPAAAPRPASAQRILSVSDPDEEARAVVREVVAAARAGVPFGRMAVVFSSAEPYARLVHQHLDAAGLPHNGRPVRTLGESLLGRTLLALLALPERRFRRSEVLEVVSSSRLLDGEGGHPPARAWEGVSREAGVVDGADWQHRLAAHARRQDARADEYERDEQPARAEHARREAALTRSLLAFVDRLQADLAAGAALTRWSELSAWARDLLVRYVGDHVRRSTWPDEERQAADRVDAVLEGLAGLDALDGRPPGLEVFHRTLAGELEAALARTGRFGEGVLVGHVSAALGVTLDRLFVLGMAEGTFPGRRLEDSLLSDRDRAAAGGELELRTERVHVERRQLLAALAGAEHATLCFPRGDLRRQADRTASRWLLADAAQLAGEGPLFTADLPRYATAPWFEEVPSFTGGLVRTAFPATPQEYALAALLRAGRGPLRDHPEVAADPALSEAVAMVEARRSARFTRFDGNLAGRPVPRITDAGTVVSATGLQTWALCPHRYLFEHVLHVDVREDPERTFDLSRLDAGSLVHEVLDRFLRDAIERGEPDGRWSPEARARLAALGEEICAEYERRGLTGRPLLWARQKAGLLADLQRFLDHDDVFREAYGARPLATELAFGLGPDGRPPVQLPLPDGRVVRFRGMADRVDRAKDGGLIVSDYKTGRAESYKHLSPDDPHQGGTHLQLVVYALAARAAFGDPSAPVRADYWFTSSRGKFERIGYEVDDAVLAEVARAVAVIADGIAAGAFPARPNPVRPFTHIDCWYCEPDGLGTSELRRAWERKRVDPVLAAYVALAEPGPEPELTGGPDGPA